MTIKEVEEIIKLNKLIHNYEYYFADILKNFRGVIKMLNDEMTQEQWIKVHKRDSRAAVAKEMFLYGESIEKICQYSKLDKNTLLSILHELPQKTQDKYKDCVGRYDVDDEKDGPIIIEEVLPMFARELYLEYGRKEGKLAITKISKLYLKEKKSIDDIAKDLKITSEEIRTALIELGHDLD